MKTINNKKWTLFFSIILFFLFLTAGCTVLKLNSTWKKSQITVDGESSDWIENMFYLESKQILLGIRNDFDYFYMCMIIEGSSLREQIMRNGFILWFDPDGGKDKTFGIKFPLGRNPEDREGSPPDRNANRGNPDFDRDRDQRKFMESFEQIPSEIEILSSKKKPGKKMPLEEANGIDVRLKAVSGIMVYEIKVPMRKDEDHPYAVNAGPEDSISLCFEIPKMTSGDTRQGGKPQGMGGGMPGGGMPPGGSRSGGKGPGGRGPGDMSQPEGLNMWLKVALSAKESSVSL